MRRAVYSISVDGLDVSSEFFPLLLNLELDLIDGETERLTITLDEPNGWIQLTGVAAAAAR